MHQPTSGKPAFCVVLFLSEIYDRYNHPKNFNSDHYVGFFFFFAGLPCVLCACIVYAVSNTRGQKRLEIRKIEADSYANPIPSFRFSSGRQNKCRLSANLNRLVVRNRMRRWCLSILFVCSCDSAVRSLNSGNSRQCRLLLCRRLRDASSALRSAPHSSIQACAGSL